MRLSQIKLAGFKSFVDPTTIHMPSNLIGVVGPNGCGKSNVIDAVRWVMGESSAKHLRGESLDDVIFNGSSVRKPVGMSMVELLFDNSDGAISGAFASFTEISVKRTLARDGTSVYYLNGSRCRRKDITGLFLGTGLGPRSYSIIEQGMVSRLIEAKPEEMRTYLEEAAGISKYKDRRRETENRIRHTRENLDRLNDLRDEVDKQLKHLQRQSRVAEKYKVYKQDQRRIGAEVLVLRLVELDEKLERQQRELDARTTAVEAAVAEQRSVETKTETARETQGECHESLNKVQESYYKHGAEIARLEQAIQHAREMRHRQERELAQIEESARDIESHIDRDRAQLADLLEMLQSLEPELEQARNSQQQSVAGLSAAEEARRDWQLRWEAHLRESNAAKQESEVERTRIEHLSGQMTALERRKERLDEERSALSTETVQEQLNQLDQDAGRQRETLRGLQSELGDYVARIGQSRERDHDVRRQLDEAFDRLRDARGKIASLEALQKAALGQGSDELSGWLARAGLGDNARLGQRLSVQPGWERAVETVLGDSLEAVCVEGFDSATALLGDLEGASVTLFDQSAASAHGAGNATALADKLQSGTTAGSLLSGVFAADNIQQAMQLRGRLQAGESVVTRDGLWLGADWLRVSRDEDVHAGVIAREQELRGLRTREAELAENVKDLEQQHNDARAALQELEEARESRQAEVSRYQDTYAEIRAQRDAQVARLEHVRGQIESLESDSTEIVNDIGQIRATLGESEGRLATAGEALQKITAARQQLEEERANIDRAEEQARNQAEADRASAQELAIKAESRRSARESLDSGIARLATQMAQLTARRTALSEQIGGSQAPLKDMEQRLASELEQRVTIEQSLTDARKALEDIDLQLRQLDTKRHETEAAVEAAREKMDQAKMVAQEARIHHEACAEQLSKTGFTTEELKEGLAEDASVASWDEQLERLQKRIDRLGPINLAAIDEFKEQSERKEYLDAQFNDLTEALDTLERAIARIDRETRTRFKETYDKVDAGLKRMFPRLFGGGHAYLQLSDDDLLHAGVNVMAQPPGKRNSTIHLLSGGEKALTAVALIFSIFELNPAPFCMLDEVDAPLDDANVERFCDIVREMSDRVQFVIITHNKVTIELANHLAGVTMQEPGVSRLVAVDVEEAVQLAAM